MGKGRFELSERGANATFGGDDAALVGNRDAFDRAEHRDVGVDVIDPLLDHKAKSRKQQQAQDNSFEG